MKREDYFLIVSAFAPYKRLDFAIDCFNRLGLKLKIIGCGQEEKRLKEKAGENIEFLGWCSDETIRDAYRSCRALIFPGEEDFGIVPLEAQACGAPVLAYKAGGALETVSDGQTGVFFEKHEFDDFSRAIDAINQYQWKESICRKNALKFSRNEFKNKMKTKIEKIYKEFNKK